MFDAGRVSGRITIVVRPLPSAAWVEDAETDLTPSAQSTQRFLLNDSPRPPRARP
jgi:hypothetical protein